MKKTYKIEVDCANCANKMEEATKKTAGVKDATVNFMTLKMIVEFEEGADAKTVMQEVLANCKKVEDDCEIYLQVCKGMVINMNKKQKKVLRRILLATILVIILELLPIQEALAFILYLIPYLIIGYDILIKAWKGIKNKQVFDENFLMAIATVGAIVLGIYRVLNGELPIWVEFR